MGRPAQDGLEKARLRWQSGRMELWKRGQDSGLGGRWPAHSSSAVLSKTLSSSELACGCVEWKFNVCILG